MPSPSASEPPQMSGEQSQGTAGTGSASNGEEAEARGGTSRKRTRETNASGLGTNGDAVMRPISFDAVEEDEEYIDVDMETSDSPDEVGISSVSVRHRTSGFFVPYYPRLPCPDF